MPEAVEIAIISEYLNKNWKGKTIIGLGWDKKSKFNKRPPKGLDLVKLPCIVICVCSRGKLIIIECSDKDKKTIYMISQLGMEGKWTRKKGNHSNFQIRFGKVSNGLCIMNNRYFFDDARHFGHFNIYNTMKDVSKNHGPCLLLSALLKEGILIKKNLRPYQTVATFDVFKKKILNKRIKNNQICDYLMKQKYTSGIGNYLRAEVIYRAKMNPTKKLETLTEHEIKTLYDSIMFQLVLSYQHHGLTIKSYWDPEGRPGTCPLQVYGKPKDLLGNPVEKFKDSQGRTVHWVPSVQ